MYSIACDVIAGYTQYSGLPVMGLQVLPNIQSCLWCDDRSCPTYSVACDLQHLPQCATDATHCVFVPVWERLEVQFPKPEDRVQQ